MSKLPVQVAIAGASGRMGRMLIKGLADSTELTLCAAFATRSSNDIGLDATAFLGRKSGINIAADLRGGIVGAQVLIDFTRPEGTMAHLAVCREFGVAAVVGTTGLTEAQKAEITAHSKHIAIVFAANMSVGGNIVFKLLDTAARALKTGFDIEIIEAHHRHKVDAPSGTALHMGEVLAAALGRKLEDCAVYSRHDLRGERDPSSIGFSTVRGGDIVGDHTVLFAGNGERIEITHKVDSRSTFAQGALLAARFLAGRANGLYDMEDVLGMR